MSFDAVVIVVVFVEDDDDDDDDRKRKCKGITEAKSISSWRMFES